MVISMIQYHRWLASKGRLPERIAQIIFFSILPWYSVYFSARIVMSMKGRFPPTIPHAGTHLDYE